MIVIPARLHSSRLPKKALEMIGDTPMIVKVAKIAKEIDTTIVATDAIEIEEVCRAHNIESVMTKSSIPSGTLRVYEAVRKLRLEDDEIVINLQGDEPFMEKEVILALKNSLEDALNSKKELFMASCYKKITKEEAQDPSLVKVVINNLQEALYFSRSVIPYDRDEIGVEYLGHLGIYGFYAKTLKEFCNLKESPLENIEKLEQLRALSHGKNIKMIEVKSQSFGIDTSCDLKKAREIVQNGG
ncbi:MAG: 3-deoxy-manno-octulosonate cytidylyltransferase [Campylobacterales bacterium]